MKKVIAVLMAAMMLFGSASLLCSCESKEERALREAEESLAHAEDVARQAEKNYNDLKKRLKNYNDLKKLLS